MGHEDADALRVLHVEDNAAMRRWFATAVGDEPGLEVVGAATDGAEGVAMAQTLRPDVIVLDQQMPHLTGLDALPLLRDACPDARVVMWCNDPLLRDRALAAGAAGFVDKAQPLTELLQLLHA